MATPLKPWEVRARGPTSGAALRAEGKNPATSVVAGVSSRSPAAGNGPSPPPPVPPRPPNTIGECGH